MGTKFIDTIEIINSLHARCARLTEMLPYYGVLLIQLQQSQESIDEELDVAKASGVQYKLSEGWNSRARNPEGLHFELSVLDSSHSSYFKAYSCCTCTYSTVNQTKDWNY